MIGKIGSFVESFLFDVLGLIIPGFITIQIFIILPSLVLMKTDLKDLNKNTLVESIFAGVPSITNNIDNYKSIYVITITITVSYILGHVIKVLSKYHYELLSEIFDDKQSNSSVEAKGFKWFKTSTSGLRKFIYDEIIKGIFTFSSPRYHESYKCCYDKIEKYIKEDTKSEKLKWELVYKISVSISKKSSIGTLAYTFLSKYNLYRSLAFIFFANIFYFSWFYFSFNQMLILNKHLLSSFFCIHAINFILWFTFHTKYKRYWTLCGDEAVIGGYCSLFGVNTENRSKIICL